MPIYEYTCAKCGNTVEVIQKMADKPLRTHAGCGGKLTKLISRSGFQFKGTGWYVTDYARKSKPESSETKTEAKTETKTGAETGKEASPSSGKAEKPSKAHSTEKTKKS